MLGAELDEDDVTHLMSARDDIRFTVTIPFISLGTHQFSMTVEDNEGFMVGESSRFHVLGRPQFAIELAPGWSMISVPGRPADESFDRVFADAQGLVSRVCTWDGESGWRCAEYDEGSGGWQGNLTNIRPGYGYWVEAQDFVTLRVDISPQDVQNIPPSFLVRRGWNLLGIWTLEERQSIPAEEYLGFMARYVAGELFHFDAGEGGWVTLGLEEELQSSKAYLVRFKADGILAP